MDRYGGGDAPSQDKIDHHAAKIEGRGKYQVYPATKEDHTLRPRIAQRLPGKPRTGTLLIQRYGKRKRQRIHKAIQLGLRDGQGIGFDHTHAKGTGHLEGAARQPYP